MQYRNANPRSFSILPSSKVDWQSLPDRTIITNIPDHQVANNEIKTTNSNFLTFIPINIFTQLSKSANIYFIVVAILQSIKSISVTNGQPMVLIPFTMVVIGVLLKDGYEEYSRYKKDRVANNHPTHVLKQNGFQVTTWQTLMIGDIVLLKKQQFAPCDFVVLQTSDQKGKCYVETKNLDGETNYKTKTIPQLSQFDIQKVSPAELWKQRYVLKYERPNPNLHHFNGSIQVHNQKSPLKISNLILRGSSLQIAEWVVGVCVYTGKQTKLLLNFVEFRTKRSNLDKLLGDVAILILLVQLILSSICAVANYLIQQRNMRQLHQIPNKPFYMMMGSWWLTMSYFVPISLIISLESVKLVQALIMISSPQMKADMNNLIPQVNNSSINEDLGQIKYIFSDKTGTLTSNVMNFKVLSVNGKIYGDLKSSEPSPQLEKQIKSLNITNVNFQDRQLMRMCNNQKLSDFFKTLYLCHDVFVEKISEDQEKYSSSSPDQISFINFTKLCGYEYVGQQNKQFIIKNKHTKSLLKYTLLALLQFSSDRKRMSVIVQEQSGDIVMYTKGADNVIVPRLKKNDPLTKPTLQHIDQFSNNGYRTLMLAKRKVSKQQFDSWFRQYSEARNQIEQRERKVERVCQKIQKQLQVIGATGIEDKLQQNVKQAIEELTNAGIIIYMLTGDKRQTAVNVGRSCGLIKSNSKIITIPQNLTNQQFQAWKTQHYPLPSNSVLLLNSSSPLNNISIPLHSTICYRCTPSQKQNIVDSVKSQSKELTLAVGDGSNDVNMITRADVGVSIRGVEGNDATRISDFVIGQFSLLSPIVLHYGREWYRKNCKLVNYVMLKNVYHVAAVIAFGIFSMFSAQVIYEVLIYQFFNTIFTIAGGCIFAAFDQEWAMKQSLKYPYLLYPPGQNNLYFNYSTYFKTFFLGMFYGMITSYIVFGFLEMGMLNNNGRTSYLLESGMVIFFIIVLSVNLKVLLMAHTYHLGLIVGVIASIMAYFVFYLIFIWYYKTSEAVYPFITLWTTPNVWAAIIVSCFITVGLDFAIKKYSDYHKNMLFNIEKEENY